ncbi:uncharacterized protein LOC106155077 isoform X2 [Lingula anatina]|uniref:Uncharacterized protein LOC106155077 isoform X2 n=1 Tax=Lingula anatina TaxID=7574 RepID=A0A1S3HGG7_LINAN|nr:uncharacterized protein LOC106155077 isoform X2 [Lingula anatina]|eukprot:XP_013385178.1 uncharacterized protein LOC106155077 isoform X2 [Lingula anatina]
MSSAGASVSEMWRKEGNQHYVSVRDSLTPDLRRQRLLSALKCYYKANDFSNTAVERSSAAKNTGMAAWKLAVVLRICNERFSLQQHYFKEAIQHFNLGITSGEPVQSEDWVKKVTGMLFSCTQEALQNCGNLETDQRVQAIEEYLNYLSPDHPSPRTDCFIEIANVLFRAGITSLQIGNYKDCLQRMHQCYQPIEEGKRSARDGIDLLQELQILENDVFIHTCVSESIQARTTGDEILQGILLNEEDLNISMIWEVVDWYRRAVLLTRELEVEMEAIALSRIGKVFDKVLKMKVKAKESYMRCIHLALSMYPRTFSDQGLCTRPSHLRIQSSGFQRKLKKRMLILKVARSKNSSSRLLYTTILIDRNNIMIRNGWF